ncbi:hypothetical protein Stsp02_44940 [Streptomyces sp. NBRC 14336]|nr:hypothetical protein Stsp02_44940 [Streptomyces sp. NBRC 14336]
MVDLGDQVARQGVGHEGAHAEAADGEVPVVQGIGCARVRRSWRVWVCAPSIDSLSGRHADCPIVTVREPGVKRAKDCSQLSFGQ